MLQLVQSKSEYHGRYFDPMSDINFDLSKMPSLKAYMDEYAKKTQLGDSTENVLGIRFGELFRVDETRQYKRVVLFPQWEKDSITWLPNQWASVNAFCDLFGAGRYVFYNQDVQLRFFNIKSANESNVITRWCVDHPVSWDWRAGSWRLSSMSIDHQKNWWSKHEAERMMLMACSAHQALSINMFDEAMMDKFNRNVVGRLNVMIETAVQAKKEDWMTAKSIEQEQRQDAEVARHAPVPTTLMVDDIDLTVTPRACKVTFKNTVMFITVSPNNTTSPEMFLKKIAAHVRMGDKVELA